MIRRLSALFAVVACLLAFVGTHSDAFWQSRAQVSVGGAAVLAVQQQDVGAAANPSGTSANYTNLTISGGLSNSALVVTIVNGDNGAGVSGLSAVWDSGGTNQSMTQVATLTSVNFQSWIFGLLAPTAGNKTLALSWTGSAQLLICAASLKNVKQTSVVTAFVNAATNAANASTATNTVTSQTNDLVVSVWDTAAGFSGTFSGSQICVGNIGNVLTIGASSDSGAASVSPTATMLGANNYSALSIDVVHN